MIKKLAYYLGFIALTSVAWATTYTRTLSEATASWASIDAWTQDGSETKVEKPDAGADVTLTLSQDATLMVDEVLTLNTLTVVGDYTLTLQFDGATVITTDDYLNVRSFKPYKKTLLTTTAMTGSVTSKVSGLKYGATGTSVTTTTGATVALSLPAKLFKNKSISVNFTESGNHIVDATSEGLYAVQGQYWKQTDAVNGTDADITLYDVASGTSTTVAGALTYSSNNLWRNTATNMLLKSYLDDGGSGASVTMTVPADFGTYTVIVYAATDTTGTQFTKKTVNGNDYTFANGETVAGTGDWGNSNSRSSAIEGENALVIVNQTETSFTLTSTRPGTPRGCVAGVQLIQEVQPTLPTAVYETTLSESTTWSALQWMKEGETTTVATETLPAEAYCTVNVSKDADLTFDGVPAVASLMFSGDGAIALKKTVDADITLPITASEIAVVGLDGSYTPVFYAYPSTIRYLAPAGTYTTTTAYETELKGDSTTATTIALAGGTVSIAGGTQTQLSMPRTGVQTEIKVSGGNLTFTDEFSFGKATATISGGTIAAPKLVTVQNGGSRSSVVTQTGGDITLSDAGDGSSTTKAAIMLGHWGSGTSVYNLSGGSIIADNGGLRLGNDSPSTLNVAGGKLKVTGIKGNGTTTCALNLSGGLVSLGANGFATINNLTATLSGGELNAHETNTIAQKLNVTGATTLSAAADKTMTVNTLSGAGALTIGTDTQTGTVKIVTNGLTDYTGAITVASGVKLQLKLSEKDYLSGYSAETVTLADSASIEFLSPTDEVITDGVEGKIYTAPLNTWTAQTDDTNWSTAANWSTGAVPSATDSVKIALTGDTTLTMDTAATVANARVVGEGTLTIEGAAKLTVTSDLLVQADLSATVATLSAGTMDIAEGKALTWDSGTTDVNLPILTGEGTFTKTNTGTIIVATTAKIEPEIIVSGGTLRFADKTYANPYTISVKSGAAIQVGTWTGSLTSTASLFTFEGGSEMWMNNGNTASGSTIAAQLVLNAENGIVKLNGSSYGSNTNLTGPISGVGTLQLANERSLGNDYTISGVISGDVKVEMKDVSNVVTLSGANTYTGGTDIVSGSTLAITTAGALGTGAITGAGTISSSVGFPSNRTGLNATAWTGTLKLTSAITFADENNVLGASGNGSSTIELAGANTGYFKQAGTCAANILLSGSMTINNGYSNSGYTFTGKLTGNGTLSTTNAQTDTIKFTGDTSTFAGTVTVAGGHCIMFGEGTRANGTLVVANGATATIAEGKTWTAVNGVTIAGTVGGTGTINSPVTFTGIPSIDATANTTETALTVASVTWPTGLDDAVIAKMVATPAEGALILKTTAEATKAGADALVIYLGDASESSSTMFAFTEGNNYVAKTVNTPTNIPEGTSEGAQETLRTIMAGSGVTEATMSGTTVGGSETLTVDQLNGALELFENVWTVTPAEGDTPANVDISYDFGISDIKVDAEDSSKVAVTVKVQNKDAEPATIIGGNTVVLAVEGGDSVEQAIQEDTDEPIVIKLPIESVNGKKLTVKVRSGITNN